MTFLSCHGKLRCMLPPLFSGLLAIQGSKRAMTSRFVTLFEKKARFYSSWNYRVDPVSGNISARGKRMSDHSVDFGFLVIDSKFVGGLVVGDED